MNEKIKLTKNADGTYWTFIHRVGREQYVEVEFIYPNEKSKWYIPISDKRKAIDYELTNPLSKELKSYLENCYNDLMPEKIEEWKTKHPVKNDNTNGDNIIKLLYDFVPKVVNIGKNDQKPIQTLKDSGYSISTIIVGKEAKRQLIPFSKFGATKVMETMSPSFRKKVITFLGSIDAYENKKEPKFLLPDHKFPEERWDSTIAVQNTLAITEEEARNKFQLLTNQRNQEKREACKKCYLTKERQCPFDIEFYYEGGKNWDSNIPEVGKEAEKGCVGCGWYDIQKWREELNKKLKENK